jgi:DNA-binding GntR family transcriptional regulator
MAWQEAHHTPYQFTSISTHIYNHLKMGILDGKYPPGDRLLVLDIANTFSVSQAPVREALERLKQEGLILSRPNKGSVVSDITTEQIRDIFTIRAMLEGYAVRESMPRLVEADYQQLEQIVQEMGRAVARRDSLGTLQLDMDFHGFFYARCGNHFALATWDRMKMLVMRFMAISNRTYDTHVLSGAHGRLIEVLRSGNAEEAERQFVQHMAAYRLVQVQPSTSATARTGEESARTASGNA